MNPLHLSIVIGAPVNRRGLQIVSGQGNYQPGAQVSVYPGGDVLAMLRQNIIGAATAPSTGNSLTIDGASTVAWIVSVLNSGFGGSGNAMAQVRNIVQASYTRFKSADAVLQDADTLLRIRKILLHSTPPPTAPSAQWTALIPASSKFEGA